MARSPTPRASAPIWARVCASIARGIFSPDGDARSEPRRQGRQAELAQAASLTLEFRRRPDGAARSELQRQGRQAELVQAASLTLEFRRGLTVSTGQNRSARDAEPNWCR